MSDVAITPQPRGCLWCQPARPATSVIYGRNRDDRPYEVQTCDKHRPQILAYLLEAGHVIESQPTTLVLASTSGSA